MPTKFGRKPETPEVRAVNAVLDILRKYDYFLVSDTAGKQFYLVGKDLGGDHPYDYISSSNPWYFRMKIGRESEKSEEVAYYFNYEEANAYEKFEGWLNCLSIRLLKEGEWGAKNLKMF